MSAGDCASPVRIAPPRLRKGLPGFPFSFPRVSNERQNGVWGCWVAYPSPLPDDDDAYRPNGVIASLDYGIFNVFMRLSVSALRVGGYRARQRRGSARVTIRGVCTDCRAYRVTTRLGMAAARLPRTQPLTCDNNDGRLAVSPTGPA